jgi:hypothetical protein
MTENTVLARPTSRATDGATRNRSVATRLASVGDWCLSADVIRAVYDSDVTADGVWSTLADMAGLSADDLCLMKEGT